MHVANYLGVVDQSEKQLAKAFKKVSENHGDEPDILQTCQLLATWSEQHVKLIKPFTDRYSEKKSPEPERMSRILFSKTRTGSLALLRDLHDLWLLANEVQLCWLVLLQASKALRDKELQAMCEQSSAQTKRQVTWLLTRIKQAAPQSLVVAS